MLKYIIDAVEASVKLIPPSWGEEGCDISLRELLYLPCGERKKEESDEHGDANITVASKK